MVGIPVLLVLVVCGIRLADLDGRFWGQSMWGIHSVAGVDPLLVSLCGCSDAPLWQRRGGLASPVRLSIPSPSLPSSRSVSFDFSGGCRIV